MIDPVINDLNRYLNRMDNESSKEEAIAARVEELISPVGDFYPWLIPNMLEALANIDSESDAADNMAAYGELNNSLRFFENAKYAIEQYWRDRATEMATESFAADKAVSGFQKYLKSLTGK